MKMKRWMLTGLVLGLLAGTGWAQVAEPMVMLLLDVETPTTRAAQGKYLDVKTKLMPVEESALTAADQAFLDPESIGRIREQEIQERMRDRQLARAQLERDNQRRQEIADVLRQEAMGTEAGRNVIQAKDWLSAALNPYRDALQVMDRSDIDFAMSEAARNADADMALLGGVTHLLRVIVGDMKTKTTTAEAYGARTAQQVKSLNVSVTISDLYNRQVYSESFDVRQSEVQTEYGRTTGGDDHGELLREALRQAGPAIARALTARLTVDVAGPRGDEDFDASYAIVRVDGVDRSAGEEVVLVKGRHRIEVELDGYAGVEQWVQLSGDLKRRIALAAAGE